MILWCNCGNLMQQEGQILLKTRIRFPKEKPESRIHPKDFSVYPFEDRYHPLKVQFHNLFEKATCILVKTDPST